VLERCRFEEDVPVLCDILQLTPVGPRTLGACIAMRVNEENFTIDLVVDLGEVNEESTKAPIFGETLKEDL